MRKSFTGRGTEKGTIEKCINILLYNYARKLETANRRTFGCTCDYTICVDRDVYLKEYPEYVDEPGFKRNK